MGLAGNPNGLGLILMFIYCLIQLIQKRDETSLPDLLFSFLKISCIVLIILTGSRNALISTLMFIIVYKYFLNKSFLIIYLIFLGIFYCLINLSSFEQFIMSNGLSDQLRLENFSTAGGRTEVWLVAWEEIKNSFWIGKGLLYDNYFIKDYVANYFGSYYARHWGGVWNSYLSLLLDVGFIGVLVYIIFWIRIFLILKT